MNQSYYPSQDPLLKFQQEMKLRKFSPKTVNSYLHYISDLLKFANKNPEPIIPKNPPASKFWVSFFLSAFQRFSNRLF